MNTNAAQQGANQAELDAPMEQQRVVRQIAKERLRGNLLQHNIELRQSDIENAGVGVFAIRKISSGTAIAKFNGPPSARTIAFTEEEVSALDEDVQEIIRKFILPHNGKYPIPKHGLSYALGVSWYINSCVGTDKSANVVFGNKRDESGYTEIVTTRAIEKGEELLLPYTHKNSKRCMTTISIVDGLERQHALPEAVVPCCRVCQEDLPVNKRESVIDIGCKCTNHNLMCQDCAVNWFTDRMGLKAYQHKPDDDSGARRVVNQWLLEPLVECELCKHELSREFSIYCWGCSY